MEEKKEKRERLWNFIFEIHKWTKSLYKECYKLFKQGWDYIIFFYLGGFSLHQKHNSLQQNYT